MVDGKPLVLMGVSPCQPMAPIDAPVMKEANLQARPVQAVRQPQAQPMPAPKTPSEPWAPRKKLQPVEIPLTPEQAYEAAMQTYREARLSFLKNLLFLAGIALVTLIAALLAGAFMGWFGVFLMVLVAVLAITGLIVRGILKLTWPKAPSAKDYEPEAPEISDVFAVRLRLNSVNLASPLEVIIREDRQVLGSNPARCKSPIPYPGVSREHCRISAVKSSGYTEYFITDLDSKNGTAVNGEPLTPGRNYPLHIGDLITFAGRYQFQVNSDAY